MNNETYKIVSIYILNKEYQLRCPNDKIQELQEAASYLEHKIKETEKQGIRNNERLMVATALNLCHKLLQNEHNGNYVSNNLIDKIYTLEQRICSVLPNK